MHRNDHIHRIRRRTRAACALVLLATTLGATTGAFAPVPAGASGTPAAGTVSGFVKNEDGLPIKGAQVSVLSPQLPPVFTDSKGRFVTAALSGGKHQFVVTAPCKFGTGRKVNVDGSTKANFFLPVDNISDGGRNIPGRYFCRVPLFSSFAPESPPLPLTGDDASLNVTLPFAFPFYGALRTNVNISTNGVLSFGAPVTAFENAPLPDAALAPNGVILAFWDDLIVDAAAHVRASAIGPAGSQIFVVDWENVLIRATGDRISFQAQLWETGEINLLYTDIDAPTDEHGVSATVGIQNDDASRALRLSEFDTQINDHSTFFLREDFAPVAKAGKDRTVALGATTKLDGNKTTDPDDLTFDQRFHWEQLSGPPATIADPREAVTTIGPLTVAGAATFRLAVTDPFGQQSFDTVVITAE